MQLYVVLVYLQSESSVTCLISAIFRYLPDQCSCRLKTILNFAGAFYPENINKIEEQNKSCDSAGGSFHSHKIFVPCNGHGRSEISTLMNSGQGGDNNTSLSQETNDIVRNSEILEDGKDVKIYHRRKRLKKADHSDFLRSDVESLHEVADSSLGDMCQIMDSSTLVKPVEFEDVSHCISLSMTEKRDTSEDGIPAEVGEKCVNADMVVSDQLEERHDEAKDITDVADGDALGGIAPLYHEEQQCVASHADLSLTLVDGTQSVSSHVAHESMDVHVGRAFAGFKPKKLLVLDINGLLVDISSYVPYNYEPDDIIMKKAGTRIRFKLLLLMLLENFLTFF